MELGLNMYLGHSCISLSDPALVFSWYMESRFKSHIVQTTEQFSKYKLGQYVEMFVGSYATMVFKSMYKFF